MTQVERLDWLIHEPKFNGCRKAGCLNEAKNFYKGDMYCPQHAREARDRSKDQLTLLNTGKSVYLYVLEAPEIKLLKFGRSENPNKRFRQVSDGSPVELSMLGFCQDPEQGRTETWIHAYLHMHRAKGEWFRDHQECRDIARLIIDNRPMELVSRARQ